MAITPEEYQARVDAWHRRRWPDATIHKIAMKLAEECGEVNGAILKHKGREEVMYECSDVLNVVAVLLTRHGYTLTEAMEYGLTVETRKAETYPETNRE